MVGGGGQSKLKINILSVIKAFVRVYHDFYLLNSYSNFHSIFF